MKTWEKPKLIVLVRNNPQEAVLTNCKNAPLSGPTIANPGCYESGSVPIPCPNCNDLSLT